MKNDDLSPAGGPVPKGAAADGQWHCVRQGETIASLAKTHGHLPVTIWDHPANQELAARRGCQGILLPGDWVFVPEKRLRQESAATDQRHRFALQKPLHRLLLRIIPSRRPVHARSEGPDKPVPYTLLIANRRIDGQTEAGGIIRVENIPADVEEATLYVLGRTLRLRIGHLDPRDEVSGMQARLNNLGYGAGPVDGVVGMETRCALRVFQKLNGLKPEGGPNAKTHQTLKERHGC